MDKRWLLSVAVSASLSAVSMGAVPAMAQTQPPVGGSNGPGQMSGAPTMTNTSPSPDLSGGSRKALTGSAALAPPAGSLERDDGKHGSDINPVLTDRGNVRASRVIGSTVYNENDEKIGRIDDIVLVGGDKPAWVIVSVGGFLGLHSKRVAVPYNRLRFGNTHDNSDNRVLMPGATKAALAAMKDYSYGENG
jgi:sporulation protein YlmC with PRC-barrel domain